MEIKKTFYTARYVYLCLLTAYTILREIIPLQAFVGNGLVVAAVFGLGLLTVVGNLWLDREHATKANLWIFIAFLGASGISTLLNFRYEFMANVKAISWMALFFFVVYPCGFHQSENKGKEIKGIFITAIVTLSIAVLISLPMYFFNLHYTYVTDAQFDNVLPQGFHQEYLRLWGVFTDPNTAAVYSFATLLMSLYLIKKNKNVGVRSLLVFADILFVMFVVLSGSRTAKVAILVACAWLAFYSVYTLLQRYQQIRRVVYSVVSVALAVVLSYATLTGLAWALPMARRGFYNACTDSTQKAVHLFYDDLYAATDMNITDGFYVEGEYDDEEELPEEDIINRPDLEGKGDVSNGRFAKWKDYIVIFSTSPIFGVSPRGISAYGKVNCPDTDVAKYGYVSHNALLEVLTGTGLVGFCIVAVMLCNAAFVVIQTTLKKKFSFSYLIHTAALLLLISAAMFLSDIFFNLTFGGLVFFLALGFVKGKEGYIAEEDLPKEEDVKRVLIYGPKDPVGGVEKIICEYVKAIRAKHDDIVFDFLQYGESFSMEEELKALGCRVIYLPSRNRKFFAYKKALEGVFQNTRYTAVWGNYSGLTNIDLLVLAKKYHVPVRIAHSHSAALSWKGKLMKYVVWGLHYYNKVFIRDYVTDFWACSTLSGEFMFPQSECSRLQIIRNAVNLTTFYPDIEKGKNTRAELNIPEDTLVIGHVARLCEVKNQSFLLKVAKATMDLRENTLLLVVGDGELRERLETESRSLGIDERTLFLGERKDVSDVLRAMDVFVLTSFSEGLSVSAIEAQASGVPCVLPSSVSQATDVSGLVKFLSLDEPYSEWANAIIEQSSVGATNVKDRIVDSGYEISVEAEKVYKAIVLAR